LRSLRPTLDVHPAEVECYGKKKNGFAWNYQGQWAGRPCPVDWAEGGVVLAAKLPPVRRLIKKAIATRSAGLGRPRFRFDSGFCDAKLAKGCLDAGADYAVAAPRNEAFWTAVRAVPAEEWEVAADMAGAEIAEASYCPKDWPGRPRAIVRRVGVDAADIKTDPRSRRLRTIDKEELTALREGRADHAYSYSMILTSLDDEMAALEYWIGGRAQIEERLKDAKHGVALRHLPSGYKVVNTVWMWSVLLALNIAAVLSAFARTADDIDPPDAGALEPAAPGGRAGRRHPLRAHGKRLRREIINVPRRIAGHARQLSVHLHPSQQAGPH
jgi:hypothetical protein